MASPEALHPVKRLYRLLKAERRDILYIYFYAIITGLISLSLPLGIQAIINYVQTAQVSTSWVVLVILVTVGIAVQGFLQVMQLSISETIQQRIFVNSAFEFAYRIPRLDLDHLHKHYAPELVNRFFDTLTLQKGLSKIVLDLSASSLQILFGLTLLSLYHPFFIIFGIFLLAILTLVVRFTSPSGLKTSMAESKYKFAVAHWLEEIARSVELFKVAGNPELPLQLHEGVNVRPGVPAKHLGQVATDLTGVHTLGQKDCSQLVAAVHGLVDAVDPRLVLLHRVGIEAADKVFRSAG